MQAYSDPARESDPHALPDLEIFFVHKGPRRSHDRIYQMEFCDHCNTDIGQSGTPCEDCPDHGWYYWYCFPGCMPDSDPVGPFATEADALADAREGVEP